jgi:hypothetical protein
MAGVGMKVRECSQGATGRSPVVSEEVIGLPDWGMLLFNAARIIETGRLATARKTFKRKGGLQGQNEVGLAD